MHHLLDSKWSQWDDDDEIDVRWGPHKREENRREVWETCLPLRLFFHTLYFLNPRVCCGKVLFLSHLSRNGNERVHEILLDMSNKKKIKKN